jgi:hypothetical protein
VGVPRGRGGAGTQRVGFPLRHGAPCGCVASARLLGALGTDTWGVAILPPGVWQAWCHTWGMGALLASSQVL